MSTSWQADEDCTLMQPRSNGSHSIPMPSTQKATASLPEYDFSLLKRLLYCLQVDRRSAGSLRAYVLQLV